MLFKYGFHPERGCKGKKSGCNYIHPFIFGDLRKGECNDVNCQKGFHLRSLVKKTRKKAEAVAAVHTKVAEKLKQCEAVLEKTEATLQNWLN